MVITSKLVNSSIPLIYDYLYDMCVRMYAHVSVCVYVCACICMCMYLYICAYLYVYLYIHVCLNVCMYVHVYVSVCVYVYMRVCMCLCVPVGVCEISSMSDCQQYFLCLHVSSLLFISWLEKSESVENGGGFGEKDQAFHLFSSYL